jgi:hypothetical protein
MKYFYVAAFLVFLALVCFQGTAGAATYAYDCPAIADDFQTGSTTTSQCLAIAARLESLDAADQAIVDRLDLTWLGVWFSGGVTTGIWAFRRLGKQAKLWGNQ